MINHANPISTFSTPNAPKGGGAFEYVSNTLFIFVEWCWWEYQSLKMPMGFVETSCNLGQKVLHFSYVIYNAWGIDGGIRS